MASMEIPAVVTATLNVHYSKPAVMNTYGDKVTEPAINRTLVDVTLTAATLEKLQEKLNAYVALLEI